MILTGLEKITLLSCGMGCNQNVCGCIMTLEWVILVPDTIYAIEAQCGETVLSVFYVC